MNSLNIFIDIRPPTIIKKFQLLCLLSLVYLFCFLNFSINKYIMNPTETANRKIDPLIK